MLNKDGIFVFKKYKKENDYTFSFEYEYKNGEDVIKYQEKIKFPHRIPKIEPLHDKILFNVHMMLGVNYWKEYCSKEILIESGSLTKEQSGFWNLVYTKGLGEFFYKNKIDFRNLINFPYENKAIKKIPKLKKDIKDRSLVYIGGGKDSMVTLESMKKNKKEFAGLILDTNGNSKAIIDSIQGLNIEKVILEREIDRKLLSVKGENTYKGHIPFSAILAWLGYLYASLFSYKYIIASNGRSSSQGNLLYLGENINHQWSKSFEFEKLFATYVDLYLLKDIKYFSLLRELGELQISNIFSKYKHMYMRITSCNRNFKLKSPSKKKWCGVCSKCAYTFLVLSPFIDKNDLINMFGDNLFNKEELLSMYKALLGVEGTKPFDCVGTDEECRLAYLTVKEKGEYKNSLLIKKDLIKK